MRPFGEHFGHDFAKIDANFSCFGVCGAPVAHRSPADVVAQTKGGAAVITLACLNSPDIYIQMLPCSGIREGGVIPPTYNFAPNYLLFLH